MTIQLPLPFRLPADLPDFLRLLASLFFSAPARETETTPLYADRNRERAFRELTDTYGRLIASVCLSFSRSREDFEDMRQDSLLNIWRGLEGFRRESAVSTWVYRVTLNTCVSFRRRSSHGSDLDLRELCSQLYFNSSPDEIERYRIMYRLIGRLRPMDRSVTLMWLDGHPYEEIAAVVGLSRNAVASRLKRARESLAEMYAAFGESL